MRTQKKNIQESLGALNVRISSIVLNHYSKEVSRNISKPFHVHAKKKSIVWHEDFIFVISIRCKKALVGKFPFRLITHAQKKLEKIFIYPKAPLIY